jgi:hypothetical protein
MHLCFVASTALVAVVPSRLLVKLHDVLLVPAGFAFVYMADERDGKSAIKALDRYAPRGVCMRVHKWVGTVTVSCSPWHSPAALLPLAGWSLGTNGGR